jgi:hypothetical protein
MQSPSVSFSWPPLVFARYVSHHVCKVGSVGAMSGVRAHETKQPVNLLQFVQMALFVAFSGTVMLAQIDTP